MELPVYELKIVEDLKDDAEVSFVALVDKPAIMKDFHVFGESFIEPSKGEDKEPFLQRCISYVINEGKESEQAVAICNSLWEQHFAKNVFGGPGSGRNPGNGNDENINENANKNVNEDTNQNANENDIKNYSNDIINELGLNNENLKINVKEIKNNLSGAVAWNLGKDGKYYLDNNVTIKPNLTKEKAKQILKHELRHIYQNKNNGFFIGEKGIYWNNELHTDLKSYNKVINSVSKAKTKEQYMKASKVYNSFPWEKDANIYAGMKENFIEGLKENDFLTDLIELPEPLKNIANQSFAIQNEEQHIISGPLMLADTPIYRSNSKFGEHYVRFSPETIKDIAIKFSKKGYQKNVNLMHDANMQVDGLVMFESFIVDKARGILPMAGYEDAKDGSWFGSFYVENEQVWKLIKEGKVKGFSVEGYFDYAAPNKEESYAEKKLKELSALLKVPF